MSKTKGVIIRSRVKWIGEGEKNTKYFLNLERRRASNNTIKEIRMEEGIVVKDPNDILLETRGYYAKLYTKDLSINNVGNKLDDFLNDSTLDTLSEDEKEMCNAPFHLEELGPALNLLKK